ncbi:long-chain fatty acid--CoA ligase [Sphingosinicella sp. LY1275]|uniref:long-chain fatty acid--CoA ligase n=1 Tax=Sphingosinicella sp. LY1275 TaxID=3095379 RepID=UPI002ADEAFF2|nr:long-chain fatty acid--CoA ligase [Sphingosinicella sp. LY1275]MEA1015249.1 long-chain fatty acid--CoA ligase [Sphingosinicella sp. LY1275]
MQEHPLLIKALIQFASREHANREVVTMTAQGLVRSNYQDIERRARQLSCSLVRLGIRMGDRIATLMTNSQWHFELYYGVSCMGAVCHTINPRLFLQQLVYIIGDADDRVLFVDRDFLPLVEEIGTQIGSVTDIVVVGGLPQSTRFPGRIRLHDYETFLAEGNSEYEWPDFDERLPSSLCYTSGTAGNPKGVLYTHRSTVLHAYAANSKDAFNLGAADVVLPLVPMFHANCWAFPYTCPMVGAKLVFSQLSLLDGPSVTRLIQQEKVTFAVGVPTIWAALLRHLQDTGEAIPTVERLQAGGAACPFPIVHQFYSEFGIPVIHGWGMTETSPIGAINREKPDMADWPIEQRLANQRKQGRGICGIEMKVVDDQGKEVPRDGVTSGTLMVRGHWVVEAYFGQSEAALDNGWLDTGDIATIDQLGFMEIVDRAKDIIKSGGEWISSAKLEQIAMELPGITRAAAIPVPHPKWDERPLLLVVAQSDLPLDRQQVLDHFQGKVARWWVPDDVVFVPELPQTNTGKLIKTGLRAAYARHYDARQEG